MKRLVLVLWALWLCACGGAAASGPAPVVAPPPANVDTSAFLEVDQVLQEGDGPDVTFNEKRGFVISINDQLPGSHPARDRLVERLAQHGQLADVVFEWFGQGAPAAIYINVGALVPAVITQAVVAEYAVDAKLPVHIAVMPNDQGFGNLHRVYVGGLVANPAKPATAADLKALLKPGLSREDVTRQLAPDLGH